MRTPAFGKDTGNMLDDPDALRTLLDIHDLWLRPIDEVGARVRWQNHPDVAALKWHLEEQFLATLDDVDDSEVAGLDACDAMRRIARDRGDVYDWLAESADWDQLLTFLAVEGGPDGGFDDLVALCQVGITGGPKVVFGENYWDEMGRGDVSAVHTTLHDELVRALELPAIPRTELPITALRRAALDGVLATNRWLQPELIGALGLLELQAGPRCRKVLKALRRLHAPEAAIPFYDVHAVTDPIHGKEWLDNAVAPLVDEHPDWGPRIVRGALWRAHLNSELFAELLDRFEAAGQRAETLGHTGEFTAA